MRSFKPVFRFHAAFMIVVLAACGAEPETHPQANVVRVELGTLDGGGSIVTIDGVRIEIAGNTRLGIPKRLASVEILRPDGAATVYSHAGTHVLVEEEALRVLEGYLFVGSRSFGAVGASNQIQIVGAHVEVDGQVRKPTVEPTRN